MILESMSEVILSVACDLVSSFLQISQFNSSIKAKTLEFVAQNFDLNNALFQIQRTTIFSIFSALF